MARSWLRCGVPMVERPRNDVSDGFSWWCRQCKGRKSIRDGSFFSKSHLPLQKWFILIFWWSHEYPVTDAAKVAEVDEGTAIDVYRWLREICSSKLLQHPILLGGPGIVVQIDESLFRHKPKVNRNKKYYRTLYTQKILLTMYMYILASPWKGYGKRSLGVRALWHEPHSITRLYGGCRQQGCRHLVADHPGTCAARNYYPFGSVAGLQQRIITAFC